MNYGKKAAKSDVKLKRATPPVIIFCHKDEILPSLEFDRQETRSEATHKGGSRFFVLEQEKQ